MFNSFFIGGFECSTHRTHSYRRLDLIEATGHDRFVQADYARLRRQGISTVREGVRWHLIEQRPHHYDFSSVIPFIHAARESDVQIIWDLLHYGWPDDLDIFSGDFVTRFAAFAREFMAVLSAGKISAPVICPVNEISFFAWAAGDEAVFYPFARGRGDELKRQLVKAAIRAIETIREILPDARFVQIEPAVNVISDPADPYLAREAEAYRLSQYEAFDMMRGRLVPELGGSELHLDIIGVNYYAHNQWRFPDRTMISRTDSRYRPLRDILHEVYRRYTRPLFIAETGIEGEARPDWLRYVCEEVRAAQLEGVPVEGICLYPIVNHPGWADDRHCHNGLWDYADSSGSREIYQPLANELHQQRALFGARSKSAAG